MAIACLRLVTFLPDTPLRNVPCFSSCMTRSTFRPLDLEYFAGIADGSFWLAGIATPLRAFA
jgi:hypothetical protein